MKVVQVADAGSELAFHLEYVKHGGTVRIVDHGRPVANLVEALLDERRRDAARQDGFTVVVPREP